MQDALADLCCSLTSIFLNQAEPLTFGVCALSPCACAIGSCLCSLPWPRFRGAWRRCSCNGTIVTVEDLLKTQSFYNVYISVTAGSDIHVLKMIWFVFGFFGFFFFPSFLNVPLKLVEMMSGQLRRAFESRTSEQCLTFLLLFLLLFYKFKHSD